MKLVFVCVSFSDFLIKFDVFIQNANIQLVLGKNFPVLTI